MFRVHLAQVWYRWLTAKVREVDTILDSISMKVVERSGLVIAGHVSGFHIFVDVISNKLVCFLMWWRRVF